MYAVQLTRKHTIDNAYYSPGGMTVTMASNSK